MSRTRILLAILVLAFPLALAADEPPAPPPDLNAPPPNATRLPDGLVTRVLVPGKGTEKPIETDVLRLRYAVWQNDGKVIAVQAAPRSVVVPPDKMLPGWREAVMMMVPGEKRRCWVPSSLGAGKIPEGKTFVIDTELVAIIHRPPVPDDVAAPPADATRTKSGLAYVVLHPGKGDRHPSRSSTVVVDYTGWTTDGRMFDSSVMRGEPAEFPLERVIKGWTEGLQLMTVGEKVRMWIPGKLAYGEKPGMPHGMLVFDVELLGIK